MTGDYLVLSSTNRDCNDQSKDEDGQILANAFVRVHEHTKKEEA